MIDNVPKISVIMSVFNPGKLEQLHNAVRSILNQTLQDFEFIICDDGSSVENSLIIRDLQAWDERIVILENDKNRGLGHSLNRCIEVARGKYIARMDADDESLPERLQVQVNFLENNPEYSWCGCNICLFDENGVWGQRLMPEKPEYEDYLKYSPYAHPTVVYRSEIFHRMSYQESKETLRCEDYEIFMRLRRMGYRGYNIQEFLFKYRENKKSYQRRTFRSRWYEAKLRYRNFRAMKILFPKGWIYVMRPLIGGLLPVGVISWMKRREAGHGKEIQNSCDAVDNGAYDGMQFSKEKCEAISESGWIGNGNPIGMELARGKNQ